jgi:hypothetical protein
LINKHRTKVTDNVDDTKHETTGREHGEVGTRIVARDGSTCIKTWFKKGVTSLGVTKNLLTLIKRVRYSLIKEIVDSVGTVNLDVDHKDHGYKNGKDNCCMDVRSQKCSLESSRRSVQNDTPRDEESSNTVINSC